MNSDFIVNLPIYFCFEDFTRDSCNSNSKDIYTCEFLLLKKFNPVNINITCNYCWISCIVQPVVSSVFKYLSTLSILSSGSPIDWSCIFNLYIKYTISNRMQFIRYIKLSIIWEYFNCDILPLQFLIRHRLTSTGIYLLF